ncbi:MAG: FKBP-type peptidyl-prolyl cis-trans isomerase [Leifsonia sp.]
MRRTVPVLSAVAALAIIGTLTACSSGDPKAESTPSAAPAVDVCATPSGKASEAIEVSTDLAVTPTATFDAGLTTSETERTVVVKGDGDELAAGGTADVAYAAFNATSGKQIDGFGYDGTGYAQFRADAETFLPGLAMSIGCITEGSRVVSVIPPADLFGADGNADLGIAADDNIVFVIDVKNVLPNKAWGEEQPAPDGLPTVKLDKDGTPTVTLPDTDAPAEFQLGVLKKGDGPVVADGATVTVQYQGTSWETGEIFDQSWGRGASQFSLSGVVPGFSKAIAGQTVGSQVIAVLPPADAYGEKTGADTDHELAGQTLVFVIDILAAS